MLEDWLGRLGNRSVLMIVDGRDTYVLPEISEALFEKFPQATSRRWLVKTAKHNLAREVDPEEFDRRVVEFFSQWLRARQPRFPSLPWFPSRGWSGFRGQWNTRSIAPSRPDRAAPSAAFKVPRDGCLILSHFQGLSTIRPPLRSGANLRALGKSVSVFAMREARWITS